MSDKLRELVRDMYEELKPGPTGGNDYHDAWQVFGERLTEAALAERAMPSAAHEPKGLGKCHIVTSATDVEANRAVEPEGERIREELIAFLSRNHICGILMDTPDHHVDIQFCPKLPPEIRSVLRVWGSIYVVKEYDPPRPALAAAQPGEPALSDYAEGVTRGQLMAAEFLEREADANYMPNEPVKVLIKGFASAIRINLKAFGMEAAPPAPSDSERVDWPECEEFYNLMQAYRHTPVVHIAAVKQNYEAVKTWLRRALSSEQAPPSEQEKS